MARVTITVEREGGSTVTIEEQSAVPLFTDEQCGRLAQEAFLRTLGALGVALSPPPSPDPDLPAADGTQRGQAPTLAQAETRTDAAPNDSSDRRAA